MIHVINMSMDISNTYIENFLKNLLQRQINFSVNNKIVKAGRLLLYRQNNYCIDLHLTQTNKKTNNCIYTIPIPFEINTAAKQFMFDYRLSTLVKNNKILLDMIKAIPPARKTRFYNTILLLNF